MIGCFEYSFRSSDSTKYGVGVEDQSAVACFQNFVELETLANSKSERFADVFSPQVSGIQYEDNNYYSQ